MESLHGTNEHALSLHEAPGIADEYPPLMDVLRQFDNPMEPIDLLSLDTPLTYLGDHMNDSCLFSPIEPHILSPHLFLYSPDDNSEDACSPPPPMLPTFSDILSSPPATPTPLSSIPSPAAVRKHNTSPVSSPPPPLSPISTPETSPFRPLGTSRHHPYQSEAPAIIATKPRKKLELVPLSNPKGCDFCQTSITPMWRRGPNGIATLCNACGLKFAKMQKLHAGSTSRTRSPPQLEKKVSPQSSPIPQRAVELPDPVPVRPPAARSLADAFGGATQLMYWNP